MLFLAFFIIFPLQCCLISTVLQHCMSISFYFYTFLPIYGHFLHFVTSFHHISSILYWNPNFQDFCWKFPKKITIIFLWRFTPHRVSGMATNCQHVWMSWRHITNSSRPSGNMSPHRLSTVIICRHIGKKNSWADALIFFEIFFSYISGLTSLVSLNLP